MQTIMTSYAERFQDNQQAIHDPVEILDTAVLQRVNADGNEIVSLAQELAFQRRLDKRLTFSELRQQICLDYDLGCVDAVTTLKRLYDNGLIPDPDHLITTYSAGVRALASGGQA